MRQEYVEIIAKVFNEYKDIKELNFKQIWDMKGKILDIINSSYGEIDEGCILPSVRFTEEDQIEWDEMWKYLKDESVGFSSEELQKRQEYFDKENDMIEENILKHKLEIQKLTNAFKEMMIESD